MRYITFFGCYLPMLFLSLSCLLHPLSQVTTCWMAPIKIHIKHCSITIVKYLKSVYASDCIQQTPKWFLLYISKKCPFIRGICSRITRKVLANFTTCGNNVFWDLFLPNADKTSTIVTVEQLGLSWNKLENCFNWTCGVQLVGTILAIFDIVHWI